MTTYQDPPLQSRRAARQGDRPESSTPSFAPPQTPRTAAGAGEPLSYVTQNRPPLPGYDASRGRRAAESAPPAPAPAPAEPSSGYRPRDFSPEARTAPPAWAPEYDRGGDVDYHTELRSNLPSAASLAESLANEPSEQTLTRRELRQIRDAAGITAPAEPLTTHLPQQPAAPQQYAPLPPVAPAPAPSSQLDSAKAEFDALAGRPTEAPRRAGRRAAPESAPGAFTPAAPASPAGPPPAPQQYPAQQPVEQAPYPTHQPVEQPYPPAPQQYTTQQPPYVTQQPVAAPPAQYAPVQPEPAAPIVQPTTGERPVGHWTTQGELDDQTQASDTTISRTVGTGATAITTSALVLPSLPGQDMATGEVMLTGSINLPSALASTGAHMPLDESDIDHLLDPGDHQLVNTDSVPIRAVKAVSGHTGSRQQLVGTPKQKSTNRALTILITAASAMVVVVVTLLVVALATDVL